MSPHVCHPSSSCCSDSFSLAGFCLYLPTSVLLPSRCVSRSVWAVLGPQALYGSSLLCKAGSQNTVTLWVSTHFAFGVNGWGFGLLLIFCCFKGKWHFLTLVDLIYLLFFPPYLHLERKFEQVGKHLFVRSFGFWETLAALRFSPSSCCFLFRAVALSVVLDHFLQNQTKPNSFKPEDSRSPCKHVYPSARFLCLLNECHM